jgi:hypothetical protein
MQKTADLKQKVDQRVSLRRSVMNKVGEEEKIELSQERNCDNILRTRGPKTAISLGNGGRPTRAVQAPSKW